MRISILKRIEALEERAKQGSVPPTLIMIHYDESAEKWNVTEHYSATKSDAKGYKTKVSYYDCLQDFYFPAEFNGRVILDTFESPDPLIYGNLFFFDIDDLREGTPGAIAIESITEPEDEKSIIATINACRKKD